MHNAQNSPAHPDVYHIIMKRTLPGTDAAPLPWLTQLCSPPTSLSTPSSNFPTPCLSPSHASAPWPDPPILDFLLPCPSPPSQSLLGVLAAMLLPPTATATPLCYLCDTDSLRPAHSCTTCPTISSSCLLDWNLSTSISFKNGIQLYAYLSATGMLLILYTF